MPRKSGVTKSNSNVKGTDGSSTPLNPEGASATNHQRGGSATRGSKRRRASNNVNSGTGDYFGGGGIIVASNPFDDDNQPSNITLKPTSKMMTSMQLNTNIHSAPNSQNHYHPHLNPLHHQQHHMAPPHPSPPTHQGSHQQLQPLHHPVHIHHQNLYTQPNYSIQNHQPPPLVDQHHTHMSTPPADHLQHNNHQVHQQMGHASQPNHLQHPMHLTPGQHSTMHNHGHMMTAVGPQAPSQTQQHFAHLQPPQAQINPQMVTNQQTHMIGTPTPPHMMASGQPAPSLSPYAHSQTPTGQNFQQQQHIPHQDAPSSSHNPNMHGHPNQDSQPPNQIDHMPMQHQQSGPYPHLEHNVYCGKCQRDIYQNEPNIICKASCRSYFHLSCSGLSQLACDLLMKESMAEWVCERCTSGNRRVPLVKYKT